MWNLASRKLPERRSLLARSWSNSQLLRVLTVPMEDTTSVPQTRIRHRQHITGQYVPLTLLLNDIEPAIVKGQDSNL